MLSDARVAPTLAVSDMRRSRRFYEDKLALTIEAEVEGTVRDSCGSGTGIALFEGSVEPMDRTVAAFEVVDLEGEVAALRERGIEVEGITVLPSGLKRAFFRDPDGNVLGMRELLHSRP
jgi:catechol 2,3-dioxygenase-like lactoylglutathione lyase family enzyme